MQTILPISETGTPNLGFPLTILSFFKFTLCTSFREFELIALVSISFNFVDKSLICPSSSIIPGFYLPSFPNLTNFIILISNQFANLYK